MSNSALPASMRRRAFVPKDSCPMAQAAEILGDKWTLLVLREAFYGVRRYDDMRADIRAPRSTLTDRLAKLVKLGVLERRPYQEDGDRVRQGYALTQKGRDLALFLVAMTEWGEEHVTGVPSPAVVVDAETREPLRLGLLDPVGRRVDIARARLTRRS